jgi:hypothetical protein
LIAVNNGTLRSGFTYDGLGGRVRIIEKENSLTMSQVRFLWCENEICEERDSNGGIVTKRFFNGGEQQRGSNFFYTRDQLGSIRELIDTALTPRAGYDYDASVYSLRARPGAPVSMPLKWEELKGPIDPLAFNIRTVLKRLEPVGDLWAKMWDDRQDIGPFCEALSKKSHRL